MNAIYLYWTRFWALITGVPFVETGTVERSEFTWGSAGNQYTWINGVQYCTWWDMHTKDWQNGDRVTFKTRSGPSHGGMWPRGFDGLEAYDIHKATEV